MTLEEAQKRIVRQLYANAQRGRPGKSLGRTDWRELPVVLGIPAALCRLAVVALIQAGRAEPAGKRHYIRLTVSSYDELRAGVDYWPHISVDAPPPAPRTGWEAGAEAVCPRDGAPGRTWRLWIAGEAITRGTVTCTTCDERVKAAVVRRLPKYQQAVLEAAVKGGGVRG